MHFVGFLLRRYFVHSFIVLFLGYFVYHTYHGERGLIAQKALKSEYAALKIEHKALKKQRISLENKITSLGAGDGQIDSDLLDEYAKKMGYIRPNEILIAN